MKKARFLYPILVFLILLSLLSCGQEMPSGVSRSVEGVSTRIEILGGGRFSWAVDGEKYTGLVENGPITLPALSPGLHSITVYAEPGMSGPVERTETITRVLLFSIGEDGGGGTAGELDFTKDRTIDAVLSGFSFDPQWRNSILFSKTRFSMGESGFDSIVLYDDGTGEYRPGLTADDAEEIAWYIDGDNIVLADTEGNRRYGRYDGTKAEFHLGPGTRGKGYSDYRTLRGTPGTGIDGKWLIPALSLNAVIPTSLGFLGDILSDIGVDFEIEIEWDEEINVLENIVPRTLGIDLSGVSTPVLYKEETGLPADIPPFAPHMRFTIELLPVQPPLPPSGGDTPETQVPVAHPFVIHPAVEKLFNGMDWRDAEYALSSDGAFLFVTGLCKGEHITLTLARSGSDSPMRWKDTHTFRYDTEFSALAFKKAWTDLVMSEAIRPFVELTFTANQKFTDPYIGIWEIESGEKTEKWYYNGEDAWTYESEDRTGDVTDTGHGTPWNEADRDSYWLNVFAYNGERFDSITPIIKNVPQGAETIKVKYEFLDQPVYDETDGTWNVELGIRCFSVPEDDTDYWNPEDERSLWYEEKVIKARKMAGADSEEYIEENNYFTKGGLLSFERFGLMKDGSTAWWSKSELVPEDNVRKGDEKADGAWGHAPMKYVRKTSVPDTIEGVVSDPVYELSGDEIGIFIDIQFEKMRERIKELSGGYTLPEIVELIMANMAEDPTASGGIEDTVQGFPPAVLKLFDFLMPIAESFENGWPDIRLGIFAECFEGYIRPLDCAGNVMKIELKELI